jgi:hypothetical protein
MMHNGSTSVISNAAVCAVLTEGSADSVPRKGDGSGWLRARAPVAP